MSDLGNDLVSENAEATRKRIQKLLDSLKWESVLIEEQLGKPEIAARTSLQLQGKRKRAAIHANLENRTN